MTIARAPCTTAAGAALATSPWRAPPPDAYREIITSLARKMRRSAVAAAVKRLSNFDLVTKSLTLIAGQELAPKRFISYERWTPGRHLLGERPCLPFAILVKRWPSLRDHPRRKRARNDGELLGNPAVFEARARRPPSRTRRPRPDQQRRVAAKCDATIWVEPLATPGESERLRRELEYSERLALPEGEAGTPFGASTRAATRQPAAAVRSRKIFLPHSTTRRRAPSVSISFAVWMKSCCSETE